MIELLAPSGSREAFVAALESGADAIYLGGQQFGARQYAPNFSRDELAQNIRQAHLLGVKVYVTVNTLVDEAINSSRPLAVVPVTALFFGIKLPLTLSGAVISTNLSPKMPSAPKEKTEP